MIRIFCPDDNQEERAYSVHIIFNILLQLPYSLDFQAGASSYRIVADMDGKEHEIVIEDHFFKRFPVPLAYLKPENIPMDLAPLDCFGERHLVVFGRNLFSFGEDRAVIGRDLFASAFFLTTRWEEFVQGRKSEGECDERLLLTVRAGAYRRPLVNEYASIIERILGDWGMECPRHDFTNILTHDVDAIYLKSWKAVFSDAMESLARKKIIKCFKKTASRAAMKILRPTPYSYFKQYRKIAVRYGIPEVFFFKNTLMNEYGATYGYNDKWVIKLIRRLSSEGSVLALHPSENVLGNPQQFDKEFSRRDYSEYNTLNIGRNHHLIWNYDIIEQWKSKGVKVLSNVGFHHLTGFRSGITRPYPIFNIYTREMTEMTEVPFFLMDTAMPIGQIDAGTIVSGNADIIAALKRYGGVNHLNWHFYEKIACKAYISSFKVLEEILSKAA